MVIQGQLFGTGYRRVSSFFRLVTAEHFLLKVGVAVSSASPDMLNCFAQAQIFLPFI